MVTLNLLHIKECKKGINFILQLYTTFRTNLEVDKPWHFCNYLLVSLLDTCLEKVSLIWLELMTKFFSWYQKNTNYIWGLVHNIQNVRLYKTKKCVIFLSNRSCILHNLYMSTRKNMKMFVVIHYRTTDIPSPFIYSNFRRPILQNLIVLIFYLFFWFIYNDLIYWYGEKC